ncbi:MAG: ABC transporter permease [Bacillota bacterium]
MRRARLLWAYIGRYFLTWLAWRSFAFTLVANQAVTPLIGLAVWSTALPDRPELTRYYLCLLLARLVTVSYESHTFSTRIYGGDLVEDLLRPHPPIIAPLAENLAIRVWHLIIGAPVLLVVLLVTGPGIELGSVAVALPAMGLAAAIRFLFTYLLALSAFWTERAHAMVSFGSTLIFLLGGEAAPLQMLPAALQPWAGALPFRAMNGFPAELAAGLLSPGEAATGFGWQVIWLLVFAALAAAVWRAGLRRYTAVGG